MQRDELNRIAFANTSMVRELIRLLPKALTSDLNLGKLHRLPLTHGGTAPPRSGMPWSIGVRSTADHGSTEVLLMLQFLSRPKEHLALWTELSVAQIRRRYVKQNALAEGWLPQVLPVVVYTGRQPWPTLPSVAGLTAPGLDARTRLQPDCQPFLLDAATLKADELRNNRAAALLAVQRCTDLDRLADLVAALFKMLQRPGTQTLRPLLALTIAGMLQTESGEPASDVDTLAPLALRQVEEPRMLAETITQWREEWHEKGRAAGFDHERVLLRRQTTLRFGETTGNALWRLLGNATDAKLLLEVGELVVASERPQDLLRQCVVLLSENDALPLSRAAAAEPAAASDQSAKTIRRRSPKVSFLP